MLAVGAAVIGGLAMLASHAGGAHGSPMQADDPYAAFCVPAPAAAVVAAGLAADHVLDVTVPQDTPQVPVLEGIAIPPVRVRQGEVVEFRVSSPREGAVAVHGVSELVRLEPHQQALVRFRALYSGRFPLHFHGRDLSHFEVAVLEIRD